MYRRKNVGNVFWYVQCVCNKLLKMDSSCGLTLLSNLTFLFDLPSVSDLTSSFNKTSLCDLTLSDMTPSSSLTSLFDLTSFDVTFLCDLTWPCHLTWPDINTPNVFVSERVLVCAGLERVLPLHRYDLQREDGEVLPQDDVSMNTLTRLNVGQQFLGF